MIDNPAYKVGTAKPSSFFGTGNVAFQGAWPLTRGRNKYFYV